jgi:uridine kinase
MFTIGIAGGTGSGKTTVVKKILERIPRERVALVPQDSYYKDSSHLPMEERQQINFDHPDSLEWDLLVKHIKLLKKGKPVEQPIYSYLTCSRAKETIPVEPKEVIILEGILIYTHMPLVKEIDIKVFVDADIIVPQGGLNEVAISILLNTIEKKLNL